MRPYQNHAAMQGHIAQWQASNLTQAAYCKEHGMKRLKTDTLSEWLEKLAS